MLSRLRADKPCEFRPPCLLGNLAPNADCGPYGPKLRTGEGDHAAKVLPTRLMSIAILVGPLTSLPKRSEGRSRLSDQLINIIVVQTEIQLLRCRRLGGGTAWHQPGCCCHDQDQHQQAAQYHQLHHVPSINRRRSLLRFAVRVLCPASQFGETNEGRGWDQRSEPRLSSSGRLAIFTAIRRDSLRVMKGIVNCRLFGRDVVCAQSDLAGGRDVTHIIGGGHAIFVLSVLLVWAMALAGMSQF